MRALFKALPLVSAFACSTLVGADFDDLELAPPARGGSGGSGNSGGSGATAGESGGGAPGGGGEAGSGDAPSGGTAQGGSPAGGHGAETSGGQNAGGTTDPGPGGAGGGGSCEPDTDEPAVVVINEVKGQGSGDDYIELYNLGPGAKNLTGYRLTDDNNAFVFPCGTVIPEHGYMLLLLGDLLTPGGPFTCFTPNPCFHETWGVSASGEDVFFRDPSNQVLDTTFYPDEMGADGVANGESWGRFPNGTGGFQATDITPEDDNALP
jgi:hypothetical protein